MPVIQVAAPFLRQVLDEHESSVACGTVKRGRHGPLWAVVARLDPDAPVPTSQFQLHCALSMLHGVGHELGGKELSPKQRLLIDGVRPQRIFDEATGHLGACYLRRQTTRAHGFHPRARLVATTASLPAERGNQTLVPAKRSLAIAG